MTLKDKAAAALDATHITEARMLDLHTDVMRAHLAAWLDGVWTPREKKLVFALERLLRAASIAESDCAYDQTEQDAAHLAARNLLTRIGAP